MKSKTFLKDKQCRIAHLVQTVDDYGAPYERWEYLTEDPLWCYTRQLSQDQVWQGMQFGTHEKRLFVLNYRSDISTGDLIEYRDRRYEVTRVDTECDYRGDLFVYVRDADQTEIDDGGNSGSGDTTTTEDDEPIIGW